MMHNRIPPPVYALLAAALMWGVAGLFPQLQVSFVGMKWLAGLFVVGGMIFDGAALWRFIRAKTTVNPLQPGRASELVITGVYRYSRNPMYLGLLLLLCAWGCWLANPVPLVILPLFVAVISRWQIQSEEQALLTLFGDAYRDYCQSVRRWL